MRGVVGSLLGMITRGRDARRRRHRPRHRVVPQPPVARLQDRRRHRAGTALAVSAARGSRRRALGIVVWPMVEFEADDALAAGGRGRRADPRVERVVICTPDKDLAQCVRGTRVVQLNRRTRVVTWTKRASSRSSACLPASIPDYLALVGDAADGYPGLPGWGAKSAAAVLARFGHLEADSRRLADVARQRARVPARSRGRWPQTATARCSSARWRRCAPTSPCSTVGGRTRWKGPTPRSRRWPRGLTPPAPSRPARPGQLDKTANCLHDRGLHGDIHDASASRCSHWVSRVIRRQPLRGSSPAHRREAMPPQPGRTATKAIPRNARRPSGSQGLYDVATMTPVERPTASRASSLTKEEAAALEVYEQQRQVKNDAPLDAEPRGAAGRRRERRRPSRTSKCSSSSAAAWSAATTTSGSPAARNMITVDGQKRSSLVVDPPDGKVPPMKPEARKRNAAFARRRASPGRERRRGGRTSRRVRRPGAASARRAVPARLRLDVRSADAAQLLLQQPEADRADADAAS